MPYHCFVRGCDSGTEKGNKRHACQGSIRPSLFKPSNEVQALIWDRIIERDDRLLKKTDRVCSLHFKKADVERNYVTKLRDGTLHFLPRKIPVLRPGAVPLRPGSEHEESIQDSPGSESAAISSQEFASLMMLIRDADIPIGCESEVVDGEVMVATDCYCPNKSLEPLGPEPRSLIVVLSDILSLSQTENTPPIVDNVLHLDHSYAMSERDRPRSVDEMHDQAHNVNLPGYMWGIHTIPKQKTAYSHIDHNNITDKTVILTNSPQPSVYIKGKLIEMNECKEVKSIRALEKLLHVVNTYLPCPGVEYREVKHSETCTGFIVRAGPRPPKRCIHCYSERRRLQKLKPRVKIERKSDELKRRIGPISMINLRKRRKVLPRNFFSP